MAQEQSRPKQDAQQRSMMMSISSRPFAWLGAKTIRMVATFGAAVVFLAESLVRIFRFRQLPNIIQQIYFIGAQTMGIIVMVALFTSMVMGLQLYYTLVKLGSAAPWARPSAWRWSVNLVRC